MYGSPTAYSTASPASAASAMRQKERVLPGQTPDDPCGGDQSQQKAEGGVQHIGKAAACGENRQPQQSQRHIDQLRERPAAAAQQTARHGGEEELAG